MARVDERLFGGFVGCFVPAELLPEAGVADLAAEGAQCGEKSFCVGGRCIGAGRAGGLIGLSVREDSGVSGGAGRLLAVKGKVRFELSFACESQGSGSCGGISGGKAFAQAPTSFCSPATSASSGFAIH